ncbi:hypothetical protein L7F22_037247 [Adiantum nelumboides]|nr:hypothetical protein [Adiantum nelumboides]
MMLKYSFLLLTLSFTFGQAHYCSSAGTSNNWDPSKDTYPSVRRTDTAFSYRSARANGNVTVPDPYNYLEADMDRSTDVKDFIDAQMKLSNSYLKSNKDYDSILKSIQNLNQFIDLEQPTAFGPSNNRRYYYRATQPDDARPIWYIATEEEMQIAYKNNFNPLPGNKWFNENLLSSDGSQTVKEFDASPSGNLMAYIFNDGGGDTYTTYVRNTSSPFLESGNVAGGAGRLPNDVLPYGAGGGVWWVGETGFFYSEEKTDDSTEGLGSSIKYHKIGDKYEQDITIAGVPKDDPFAYWNVIVSTDQKWLVAAKYKGVDFHNTVYIASLNQTISGNMKWQSIAPDMSAQMYYLSSIGNTIHFATDDNAPNIKVISVEIDESKARTVSQLSELTQKLDYHTVIPEKSDALMDIGSMDGWSPVFETNKLLTYYVRKAKYDIYLFDLSTGEQLAQVLPDQLDTVTMFKCDQFDSEYFLSTTTINKPKTIYRFTLPNGKLKTEQIFDTTVSGVDLTTITSEQRWSTSKDGTKVPFYLFSRKGQAFNGTSPVWIYSYGQYGYNILPTYKSQYVDWIINYNGVMIWGSPRGGGENGGEHWHEEGMKAKRQNTVDDVISFAEYAVENKISAPGKIVVNGGSASGTTAMVAANQAPEGLFGGACVERGVLDMLRFDILEASGTANYPEYGNPNDPSDFDYLIKYSPLHNVNKTKEYPTVLLYTTTADARVAPSHSFKMVAELQHDLPKNKNPLLMYLAGGAGHETKLNSRTYTIETSTIKQAILAQGLGLKRCS